MPYRKQCTLIAYNRNQKGFKQRGRRRRRR